MANTAIPRTRAQKGRAWATATLVICGAFSIWANVRSGQIRTENVIVSVMPPLVAFLTSHLISYFSPRSKWGKTLVYGVLGAISLIAMYGSGFHIVETVIHTGQPWQTALSYVFITDAPMLLAAVILAEKMSTARETTTPAKRTSTTTSAKKTTPAKTISPTKAVKAAPTKTVRTKSTQTSNIAAKFIGPAIVDENADMVA